MRFVNNYILLVALAFSVLGSSTTLAQVEDCHRVAFSFTNRWTDRSTPVDIRVRSVTINGTRLNWTEDLRNQVIEPNRRYTTKQRRLQGHDDGEAAFFTVNFDHRRTAGAGWENATHGPFEMLCRNGDTLRFTIMHNN